jgi:hypothetical protein
VEANFVDDPQWTMMKLLELLRLVPKQLLREQPSSLRLVEKPTTPVGCYLMERHLQSTTG